MRKVMMDSLDTIGKNLKSEYIKAIAKDEPTRIAVEIHTPINGTTKMNEAAELSHLKNKELQAKKMGQKSLLKTSSHNGSFMVQISTHFIADLKRLADLKRKMDELGRLLKS